MSTSTPTERPKTGTPQSLSGLWPFVQPYLLQMALAGLFLVLAAVATLLFPVAVRQLIDGGLVPAGRSDQAMTLQGHFIELFGVAEGVGSIFSCAFLSGELAG